MQTANFSIDLMTPMQFDREIVFNEAISKLDNFCNLVIKAFVDITPQNPVVGDKYIIKSGYNLNQIFFCDNLAKGWQNFIPKFPMMVFVLEDNCFYLYNDNQWHKINNSITSLSNLNNSDIPIQTIQTFKGVRNNLIIEDNANFLYFYLDGHTHLDLSQLKSPEVTFVIKQNFNNMFQFNWSNNILWPAQTTHKMSQTRNAIDIIKLYKLAETNHFIGQIIGQNYQY